MSGGLLEELIKQIPAVGCLALIVIVFLKHLEKRDANLSVISKGCHEIQKDAIKCINENTRVLGEVCSVLLRLNGKGSHAMTHSKKAGRQEAEG